LTFVALTKDGLMTKISRSSALLFIFLFFLSCKGDVDPSCQEQNAQASPASTTCQDPDVPEVPVEPIEPPPPLPEPGVDVPPEASDFAIKSEFTNFTDADKAKVEKAFSIIKSVIRTSAFRDRVINFSYEGSNRYVDSDLSPEEIYQILLDGSEDLAPGVDHEMDLNLELYSSSSSTVGYTYANVLTIWMNKKFFDSFTPSQVAGNVFHEWTHKLGFEHSSLYTLARDSSVPYAIGYLIEELGKEFE
jgi:hypothetical protein